jgi:hypothetical protein
MNEKERTEQIDVLKGNLFIYVYQFNLLMVVVELDGYLLYIHYLFK